MTTTSSRASGRAPRQSIYLAGKIEARDWRTKFLEQLREARPEYAWFGTTEAGDFAVLPGAVYGLDYTGPHAIGGCRHGCLDGPDTHAVGAGVDGRPADLWPYCCAQGGPSRRRVVEMCLDAIRAADIVFAWLEEDTQVYEPDGDPRTDDPLDSYCSAYGTLVEIGYAVALEKLVVVASPVPLHDVWFAGSAASVHIVAASPDDALRQVAAMTGTVGLGRAA
jgi:hypothetical protein